jgi:hypothetical protein
MPRRRVVPVVEIAPQVPAVTRNPRLIVPNVAPVPPVAILGKHRFRSHSDQQQNPSYHAFHIPFLFDPRRLATLQPPLLNANPLSRFKLRRALDTILYEDRVIWF